MINGRIIRDHRSNEVGIDQVAVGVLNGGIGCGNRGDPIFYTRIDYHHHWIQCVTKKVTEGHHKLQVLDQCTYALDCNDAFGLCHVPRLNRPCFTVRGGPKVGRKCIFPFKFEGKTYHGCPVFEEDDMRWCSTEVDSDGNHVLGQNAYGTCAKNCPYHDDK